MPFLPERWWLTMGFKSMTNPYHNDWYLTLSRIRSNVTTAILLQLFPESVQPAVRVFESRKRLLGLVDPKSTWRNWPTTSSNFPMAVLSHEYSSTVHTNISCIMVAPCKRIVFVEAFANDDLCISCIVLSNSFNKNLPESQKVSESQVSATSVLENGLTEAPWPFLHALRKAARCNARAAQSWVLV